MLANACHSEAPRLSAHKAAVTSGMQLSFEVPLSFSSKCLISKQDVHLCETHTGLEGPMQIKYPEYISITSGVNDSLLHLKYTMSHQTKRAKTKSLCLSNEDECMASVNFSLVALKTSPP